ncbi:MAG: hypothetical protein GY858_09095 [Candidatus Omnitrophica bacterium]|nr:hypothetical protein [Candidatus Omnitrophota bacterium]
METNCWKNKLLIFDKRISAFINGYRQNITLIGDDDEEISYLLDNYLRDNNKSNICYLRINASFTDQKWFFKNSALALLSSFLNKTASLDDLINESAEKLPLTTSLIRKILHKNSPTFSDMLELINIFIKETEKRCVLIIENFIAIKSLFSDAVESFTKFIIVQRDCMAVLTTTQRKEAEKSLSSELNLLFGNFEKIYLNERSFIDNYLYLKSVMTPQLSSPFVNSFFVNILGNNILYHNLIADEIKKTTSTNEDEIILTTLTSCLFKRQTYFFQKFLKRIDAIDKTLKVSWPSIKILLSLSDGYLRKNELSSLRICDLKNLNSRLAKLCDLDYVTNYGNIYKIKDPLFSFWLKHAFKLCQYQPFLKDKLWQKNICEEIDNFKENFRKDKIEKVVELIACFNGDCLKMGKTSYRLPQSTTTKLISYPKDRMHLIVGEGKELMFIGIKEKDTKDSDIFKFIEKGSGIKGRKINKIFIALDQFPHSARLAAKRHKLTAWDVNEVNDLMRIYNKPVVSL